MRGTMNAEQKRIAIAEACGWVFDHIGDGAMYYAPIRDIHVGNPLTDLNAVHEAEKTLTGTQWDDYEMKLRWVTEACIFYEGAGKEIIHATAAQRADAFLITLGLLKP